MVPRASFSTTNRRSSARPVTLSGNTRPTSTSKWALISSPGSARAGRGQQEAEAGCVRATLRLAPSAAVPSTSALQACSCAVSVRPTSARFGGLQRESHDLFPFQALCWSEPARPPEQTHTHTHTNLHSRTPTLAPAPPPRLTRAQRLRHDAQVLLLLPQHQRARQLGGAGRQEGARVARRRLRSWSNQALHLHREASQEGGGSSSKPRSFA